MKCCSEVVIWSRTGIPVGVWFEVFSCCGIWWCGGVGGHVATGLSAALPGVPTSLAVDAAGRIVVLAGEVLLGNPELPSSYAPVLLRYLPDGRADTSFGNGGKIVLNLFEGDEATAV